MNAVGEVLGVRRSALSEAVSLSGIPAALSEAKMQR
jgi:hypothetical protein